MKLIAAVVALAVMSSAGPAQQLRPKAAMPTGNRVAHLNHFFATIDPVTADAIKASAFLREFANFEVKTTSGSSGSWTGRYLRGRQTYLELFSPDDYSLGDKPAPVGMWGLALSGDAGGSLDAIRKALEGAGHSAESGQQTRTFGQRTVPWFTALNALSAHGNSGDQNKRVSAWAMEYDPIYFDDPEAEKEIAEGPDDVISRERYQSDNYKQKMMRDVSFVRFAASSSDVARIEPLLKAAGFVLRRSAQRVTATSAEALFHFDLTTCDSSGLREIGFTLNKPAARRVEIIGRSKLMMGPGASANWTFR